jgi:hypothetical protein
MIFTTLTKEFNMRTKLINKGQANPAPTYGRGALFTVIFALAITFTFSAYSDKLRR